MNEWYGIILACEVIQTIVQVFFWVVLLGN